MEIQEPGSWDGDRKWCDSGDTSGIQLKSVESQLMLSLVCI